MPAPILNRETLVPIGVAISVATAFVFGAFWIKDGYGALDKRIDIEMSGLRQELREMNARLIYADRQVTEAWTVQDMAVFALEMRINNPELQIPDPRTIHPRK